jgi:hypothetical protein
LVSSPVIAPPLESDRRTGSQIARLRPSIQSLYANVEQYFLSPRRAARGGLVIGKAAAGLDDLAQRAVQRLDAIRGVYSVPVIIRDFFGSTTRKLSVT